MDGAAMIFDPNQKKKKKSKSKKAFDLDKALEQVSISEDTPSKDSPAAQSEATDAAATAATDNAADDVSAMFQGRKKKSHKTIDHSQLEAQISSIEEPATPDPALPEQPADTGAPVERKKKAGVTFDTKTTELQPSTLDKGPAGRDTVYTKDSYDSSGDYTYDELLTRVFNIMKEKNPTMVSGERKKFVMKPPQISKLGTKKTAFANFADICKILHRPPKHLLQYLLAELGTSGSVDGSSSLIIRGRFQQKQIENVLRSYIKEYVTCHTCKSPDTTLERETRLFFLQCTLCGSRVSVSSIQTGFSAVIGKRAVLRRKVQ